MPGESTTYLDRSLASVKRRERIGSPQLGTRLDDEDMRERFIALAEANGMNRSTFLKALVEREIREVLPPERLRDPDLVRGIRLAAGHLMAAQATEQAPAAEAMVQAADALRAAVAVWQKRRRDEGQDSVVTPKASRKLRRARRLR